MDENHFDTMDEEKVSFVAHDPGDSKMNTHGQTAVTRSPHVSAINHCRERLASILHLLGTIIFRSRVTFYQFNIVDRGKVIFIFHLIYLTRNTENISKSETKYFVFISSTLELLCPSQIILSLCERFKAVHLYLVTHDFAS